MIKFSVKEQFVQKVIMSFLSTYAFYFNTDSIKLDILSIIYQYFFRILQNIKQAKFKTWKPTLNTNIFHNLFLFMYFHKNCILQENLSIILHINICYSLKITDLFIRNHTYSYLDICFHLNRVLFFCFLQFPYFEIFALT